MSARYSKDNPRRYPELTECHFANEVVFCDKRLSNCAKCGWNPAVAAERLRKYQLEHQEELRQAQDKEKGVG